MSGKKHGPVCKKHCPVPKKHEMRHFDTNTPITKPFLTFDQKEIYKFSVLANLIPSMEFSFKSTLVCCWIDTF